jgi:hypothetical protein
MGGQIANRSNPSGGSLFSERSQAGAFRLLGSVLSVSIGVHPWLKLSSTAWRRRRAGLKTRPVGAPGLQNKWIPVGICRPRALTRRLGGAFNAETLRTQSFAESQREKTSAFLRILRVSALNFIGFIGVHRCPSVVKTFFDCFVTAESISSSAVSRANFRFPTRAAGG